MRKKADPRAELVRRLLEYEQMKTAAQRLDELPQAERDFSLVRGMDRSEAAIERLPEISVDDLRNAWLMLMARSQANRRHHITREELSVRAHMSRILRQLQGHKFVEFNELFNPAAGVAELVVTFLALLELVREHQVEISQPHAFGIIYVRPVSFLYRHLVPPQVWPAPPIRLKSSGFWKRRCSPAQEPLPLSDLKKLFDEELERGGAAQVAGGIAQGLGRKRR